MNKTIKTIKLFFGIIGVGMVSMITGYGMFFHYALANLPIFFCVKVGMFTSGITGMALAAVVFILNNGYNKQTNRDRHTKAGRSNLYSRN